MTIVAANRLGTEQLNAEPQNAEPVFCDFYVV